MPVEKVAIPKFKKELSRNLISNVSLFLFNIFIGLLIVPFYIDTLGIAAYGILPLATSFTGYVMLILESLNASIARFITIYIQKSDLTSSTQIFNTALMIIIGLILFLTPIAIGIAWFIPEYFEITAVERNNVFFLFLLIFFSSFINALRSPFSAVMYAFNKIHYNNYISLFYKLFSIGIIVAIFFIYTPSIYYVGLAYFVSAICSLILTVVLSRKTYDKIPISISYFSNEKFSELTTLSKWILVDQIGTLLLLQLSLIIVTKEFGTAKGGEYAIVTALFNVLWAITGIITSLLSPMYYTYYARGLFGSIRNLSVLSVKSIGLVMALPTSLICIFAPQILTIWVGPNYSHLSLLLWILLIPLTMIVAVRSLIISYAAYNKVRVPAIVTIVAGLLNLVLAITLPNVFDLGVFGVAIAFILALWVRNVIFVPWYSAKVQGISPVIFYKPIIPGSFAFFILFVLGYILTCISTVPSSILYIVFISGGISLAYYLIIIRIAFTNVERKLIRSILPSFVSKVLPTWLL